MKIYTLTYDCNAPAKQQINVPTNTDYKVGVKVVRNGKNKPLYPEAVTLGTLSADADTVNGYVTFTKRSGSEQSRAEETLSVNYQYNGDLADYKIWYGDTGSTVTNLNVSVDISADYAGFTITPNDVSIAFVPNNAAEVTEEKLNAVLSSFWNHSTLAGLGYTTALVRKDNYVVSVPGKAVRTTVWHAGYVPQDVPFFVKGTPEGIVDSYLTSYTLEEGDTFVGKPLNVKSGKYTGQKIAMSLESSFNASFKLIENVYQSQVGDLAAGIATNKTVALAGEYADGTEFSYDVLVK